MPPTWIKLKVRVDNVILNKRLRKVRWFVWMMAVLARVLCIPVSVEVCEDVIADLITVEE